MKPKVFLHPGLQTRIPLIHTILQQRVEYVDRLQDADVAVFEQKSDIPPSPECPKEVFCIYIQGEDSEETNHHHLPESKLFSIGNEIFNGEAYKDFLVQSD